LFVTAIATKMKRTNDGYKQYPVLDDTSTFDDEDDIPDCVIFCCVIFNIYALEMAAFGQLLESLNVKFPNHPLSMPN
jgi:hypothetical protein